MLAIKIAINTVEIQSYPYTSLHTPYIQPTPKLHTLHTPYIQHTPPTHPLHPYTSTTHSLHTPYTSTTHPYIQPTPPLHTPYTPTPPLNPYTCPLHRWNPILSAVPQHPVHLRVQRNRKSPLGQPSTFQRTLAQHRSLHLGGLRIFNCYTSSNPWSCSYWNHWIRT